MHTSYISIIHIAQVKDFPQHVQKGKYKNCKIDAARRKTRQESIEQK